jgi:hypothetical protein
MGKSVFIGSPQSARIVRASEGLGIAVMSPMLSGVGMISGSFRPGARIIVSFSGRLRKIDQVSFNILILFI